MLDSLIPILAQLAMLCPFGIAALGVILAVFGKAARRCPFQPNECRVFARPTLPRSHSKIYVVDAIHASRRRRPLKFSHEDINS